MIFEPVSFILHPEEYKQYQTSLRLMSDYYNIIDTAAEEAEKRGRAD